MRFSSIVCLSAKLPVYLLMEFEQIKRVSYERHCGLRGLDDDIKDLDLHFIQFLLVSVLTHELL